MSARLGFGTAGLLREPSKRRRLDVLAAALDSGIRHFDTAPLYGLGAAERLLGEFLAGRREPVTIATKFGLMPSTATARLAPLQSVARAVLKALPGLRRIVRGSAGRFQAAARFDVPTARRSLDTSLTALRRDRVDLLLLHECTPTAIQDDSLLGYLQELCAAGRIGTFGTATGYAHTVAMLGARPDYCRVLQFDSDVLTQNVARLPPQASTADLITHSVLTRSHSEAMRALQADAVMRNRWNAALDADAAAPGVLSRLLLQAALQANPRGIVLVHSNSPQHIAANAAAAAARADPLQLAELMRLLQTHFARRALTDQSTAASAARP